MKYLPYGSYLHTEAFLPALLDFIFYNADHHRSAGPCFGDVQGKSVVMRRSCVRQSSAVLLNFI